MPLRYGFGPFLHNDIPGIANLTHIDCYLPSVTTTGSLNRNGALRTRSPKSYTDGLFQSVATNQLSPSTSSWLSRVLFALDSKDVDAYCSFMSPAVTITFNNGVNLGPNMSGVDAVREGLKSFWQGFKSIRHEELMMLGTEKNLVHEALNHYGTLDGRHVTVRAVAFIDRDFEGRIEAMRIYNDQSPVWSA